MAKKKAKPTIKLSKKAVKKKATPEPSEDINIYNGFMVFEITPLGVVGLPTKFQIGDLVQYPSPGTIPAMETIVGIYTDGSQVRYRLTNCLYFQEKDLSHVDEKTSPKGRIKRSSKKSVKKASKKTVKKAVKRSNPRKP